MSKKMSRYPSDRKVYVGDLGNNARKNELEYAFSNYGTLRSVWIARNPPGFAFVEFEDSRDASDAVRGLDGRTVCGRRARVELSTGKYASSRSERRGSRSRGRPFHPDDKCYECGGRGHYARDCRRYGRRRRSHSRSQSRSRSYSRDNRTRSRTGSRSKSGSRSRSRSLSKDSREPREDRKVRDARRSKENGHKNGDSHYSDDDRQISRSPQRGRYHKSRSPIRSNSRHEREESKSSKKSRSISLRQRDSRSRSISCSRSRSR